MITRSQSVKKSDSEKQLELLERLYYDVNNQPDALTSVKKLQALLKKSQKQEVPVEVVREYLHGQHAYTKHRPAVKKAVRRNKMIAAGLGTDFQADLSDMQNLSHVNKGFRYILCVIDIFTRMAYCETIKR